MVSAGGFAVFPPGVQHALCAAAGPVRMLVIVSPGSSESFYRAASEEAVSDEPAKVDFGKIRQAATETGVTNVIGPPPFRRP